MTGDGTDLLTIYRSRSGRTPGWRWRYQAAGNRAKMAAGNQAYSSLDECIRAALRVVGLGHVADGAVRDLTDDGVDELVLGRVDDQLVVRWTGASTR